MWNSSYLLKSPRMNRYMKYGRLLSFPGKYPPSFLPLSSSGCKTWFWTSTLKSISHVNEVEGTQFLRVVRWEEWGFLRGLLWGSVWPLKTYTGTSRFMHCLSSALGGWSTCTVSTSSVVTWLPGGWALETLAQDHMREERERHISPPPAPSLFPYGTPLQYSCLENPMDGGAW